jgi:hypothetical protein
MQEPWNNTRRVHTTFITGRYRKEECSMTKEEFEAWLQRAESNLEIARWARREKVLLEDLCFDAQQAAEKALKALLGQEMVP